MKVKSALAALPLVLNACGGENSSDVTPNELGQGIWEGGFSSTPISVSSASGTVSESELTKIEKTGVGLYTTNKKVFFYNIDDDILFTNADPGFFNSNLYYSPDYYINGNIQPTTIIFNGNAYVSTSIVGGVSSPLDGNYVMIFDNKYFRGADLNRLMGNWSYSGANGDWNLAINSDGSFTGGSTKVAGCTLDGAFSIIDASKNEYNVDVTLHLNCAPYDGSYTGLAATVDSVSGVNDTILMAIYNSNNGFFMKPEK